MGTSQSTRAKPFACSCPAGFMGAPFDPWTRFSRFQSVSPWRTNTKSRVGADVRLDPAGMGEKLRVQDGSARRTSDRVVAERVEFPVEHGTGADAPDRDPHARRAVHVEAGLRAV